MNNSIKDDNAQSSHNFSQSDDEERPHGHEVDRGNGIKDVSEQDHHDNEIFPFVTALQGPSGANSQQKNDTGFLKGHQANGEIDIKDATEQDRDGDV